MSRRRVAALLVAALALGGCGEKAEPDLSNRSVVGTVDIRPAAPGAGNTVAATTRETHFQFVGRVRPAVASVTLTPPPGRAASVRRSDNNGQFHAQARKLRRGANRFLLRGATPGLRPWTLAVSITRK